MSYVITAIVCFVAGAYVDRKYGYAIESWIAKRF